MTISNKHKTIYLQSLGCDKNLVDSEKTLGLLIDAGYDYTADINEADIVIVNTCCFINDAKKESIDSLLEVCKLREGEKRRAFPKIIVMGCMAERYKDEIIDTLPEVDAIVGTNAWQDIVSVADRLMENADSAPIRSFRDISLNRFKSEGVNKRVLSGLSKSAYLKIAEGCNKHCSYCVIPSLKGAYRSVPMEKLIKEAEFLAAEGVKEINIIAEETASYGIDLYGRKMLHELLTKLNNIEGIEWIRVLYAYPEEIYDELIHTIASLPKLCHYIDMPLQHASNHILRRMNRATSYEEIRERILAIRKKVPDIVLRTTLISGFPGETNKDHEFLLNFLREIRFDKLGVFCFSKEEGTPAASFSHPVSKSTAIRRREEIMALSMEISREKIKSHIGEEMPMLIEGKLVDSSYLDNALLKNEIDKYIDNENIYVGRTYMDAPDIDGLMYVRAGKKELFSGDMVNVRIDSSFDYDLMGVLV